MDPRFIHLHVHSEYSLVDGLLQVDALVDGVRAAGMPAIALTDVCNLFALVKFYRRAEAAGIKPIAGSDVWIAHPDAPEAPFRLTLLCRHRAGYVQLSRLLSRAYVEGYAGDRPLIDSRWLEAAEVDGLIALSGLDGDLGQALVRGDERAASQRLPFWLERFGDRYYLEVTRTGRDGEALHVPAALHLAHRHGVPVVASNDVRFLHREDFQAHEARVCIHQGRVLADARRPREYTVEQYLKSPAEMAELFADLPGALENSLEIARRCSLELRLGQYFLPAFPVPEGETLDSHLRKESRIGLARRLQAHGSAPGHPREAYAQRLETELDVIVQMGFPGYFLIVADFIRWAKRNGIPVGPGRGSGAGSLVAWALDITDLDPIRYDLLFERFLNPERVSMPDFDIDFCMERRDEVIQYVREAYGHDRVSQIITYGSMAAKAVLRDTGRVLGMSYGHVDGIAKLVPNTLGITLEQALNEEPELRERYQNEDDVATLIDLARKLEGLARNAGKHAGGVVIAPGPLTDFVPLFCEPEAPRRSDGQPPEPRTPVTQFDKDDVEAIGLVKFDFLGLRTLTIIDWAVKAINARRSREALPPIDINALPTDDPDSYALLKRCETTAVFQLESRGMKELIRKLKPDTFEDIIALVALFRPGPLQSGMVDDFIARKHGQAEVSYPHPLLEPILRPTYGVIVYQEQVMQIAQVLAGYTLGGADLLRRAMGKKKPEEMAKQRQIFLDGATANGVEAERASAIFDLMEKFAEYGFNKSHSAAYALVSYQTAWLKAHYPAEFMAAVLSSDLDNTDKVVVFIEECRMMQIPVDPPHVNDSNYRFEADAEGRRIRWGLGAIKGVGANVVRAIVAEREAGGPFRDLGDFCHRLVEQRINRRVMEALIQAGALDGLGVNRATLNLQLPDAMRAAEQRLRDLAMGQRDIFDAAPLVETVPLPPPCDEWSLAERLEGERATLGLYLSGHPMDAHETLTRVITTARLGQIPDLGSERRPRGQEPQVCVAGQVTALRKRGETMAFVQIEDRSGRLELALYREVYTEFQALLLRDAILVAEGALVYDEFNGGFQVRVRQLQTIEQAYQRHARLVRIRLESAPADFSERLRAVLQDYRGGPTSVRIDYRRPGVRAEVELGPGWRVRYEDELLRQLAALPGVSQVQTQFARGPQLAPHPSPRREH